MAEEGSVVGQAQIEIGVTVAELDARNARLNAIQACLPTGRRQKTRATRGEAKP